MSKEKRIGFDRDVEEIVKASKQEHNDMEALEQVIRKEIDSTRHIERDILAQLSHIKHLEHNFALLQQKMMSVMSLDMHREAALKKLSEESNKRNSEIDTKACSSVLSLISTLDGELHLQLEFMISQLNRLRVEDAHEIYRQNDESKATMKSIDKKARAMLADAQRMGRKIQNDSQHLRGLHELMKQIDHERKNKWSPNNTVGFK